MRWRRTAPALGVFLTLGALACSGQTPPPTTVSPTATSASGLCRAILYPGSTGGQRIQAAVNDAACRTVQIDTAGPDASSRWLITEDISLRSNLTLESSSASPAVLTATTGNWRAGMLRIEDGSNVVIRRLVLQLGKLVPNGVWITGSRGVTITQGTIANAVIHAVHVTLTPSSTITIAEMTFTTNGAIDVRSDTAKPSLSHAQVLVVGNTMSGSGYGVALADCGGTAESRCEVRGNAITRVSSSGIDLNRSHFALVTGNTVSGCQNGITVDDVRNATLTQNVITGCRDYGIVLANGAVPTNRPWILSGNRISGNTISTNGRFGLASYGSAADPNDRNESNVWNDNRLQGNVSGGCVATAAANTFTGNGPQDCAPQ